MSKKAAFTMVELIFVIVILGILAAVAVPRLNASRQDAQTAKLKANLVTLAKDFEAYYAANGSYCPPGGDTTKDYFTPLANITNVTFDGQDLIEGFFNVNDKKCLKVTAGRYKKGFQSWDVYLYSGNPECLEELKKEQYKDIEWFFTGYRSYDFNSNTGGNYGDVREMPGTWARHWMNDPSKGVDFD